MPEGHTPINPEQASMPVADRITRRPSSVGPEREPRPSLVRAIAKSSVAKVAIASGIAFSYGVISEGLHEYNVAPDNYETEVMAPLSVDIACAEDYRTFAESPKSVDYGPGAQYDPTDDCEPLLRRSVVGPEFVVGGGVAGNSVQDPQRIVDDAYAAYANAEDQKTTEVLQNVGTSALFEGGKYAAITASVGTIMFGGIALLRSRRGGKSDGAASARQNAPKRPKDGPNAFDRIVEPKSHKEARVEEFGHSR